MDFFLWGHIKALIYTLPIGYEEDLIARVAEATVTLRQQLGIFERTRQSLLRRCRLCIEVGGRTFEHLF
jgi:glycerol-3-phosphate cytidylyltransferase-like family protein